MCRKYSKEIIDRFIEMAPYYLDKELSQMFNMPKGTVSGIQHKRNIKKTAEIQQIREQKRKESEFKKGSIPHNKGRKMTEETYKKVQDTMFKKGNKPSNWKPAGYERITSDGFIMFKPDYSSRFVLKARYIYQKHHNVVLTKQDVVRYKDNNKLNLDIDNLYVQKRGKLVVENHFLYPTEILSTTRLIKKIQNFINNAEKQN